MVKLVGRSLQLFQTAVVLYIFTCKRGQIGGAVGRLLHAIPRHSERIVESSYRMLKVEVTDNTTENAMTDATSLKSYQDLLSRLKSQIRTAQVRAASAVKPKPLK